MATPNSFELHSTEFPRTPTLRYGVLTIIDEGNPSPIIPQPPFAQLQLNDSRPELFHTNRHVICIPKVSNKITKQYIFSIFCSLKVGFIEKLTEVPIKSDPLHKRVFVKIKWNNSNLSKYIYDRFESGENVKVVYSDPWYWICVSNASHTVRMTDRIHLLRGQ